MTKAEILALAEFDALYTGGNINGQIAPILRSMISRGEAAEIAAELCRDENARLRPLIEALAEVAEAADQTKTFEITDGCEHCSALWTREYENKKTMKALARLKELKK